MSIKTIKAEGTITPENDASSALELEAVNSFAKTALTRDEVYTFSVLLCDNGIDRDFERFSESTLAELSELFVGRTGISDHDWKSDKQKARIYRTELVTDEQPEAATGAPYTYIKAYAYMLRTEDNASLIAEIEGGIKKEVSVGCAVAESICSICGEEIGSSGCGHIKGQEYDGRLCYAELTGAVDAYEWSFVAVPAQRMAGVMKKQFGRTDTLKDFVERGGGESFKAEYERLEKEASAGRKHLEALRKEVLRLSLLSGEGMYRALEKGADRMDVLELESMREAFEKTLEGRFPPHTQLPGRNENTRFDGEEYMI